MESNQSGVGRSADELAAGINNLDIDITGDVLANEELVLDDVQADDELGEELLVQGDIRSLLSQRRSRFIITAQPLTAMSCDEYNGEKAADLHTVKLTCHFQAAPNTRFVEARVSLKIHEPKAAVFLDVAPEQVKSTEGVKVTINKNGTFSFMVGTSKSLPVQGNVSASLGRGVVAEYVQYTCELTGAGAATDRAT